ncbi:hypothetical protein SCARR_01290 [Pontiella sulfatireligans]|uniref:Uncharacterized protein n=2 Tax=Pontiella sulfatireligans TaxID=2750658 RepID=A0A6C2UHA2_9BACT|nr:hypothetical protein SCARR_01290 [Pontiella sulfatireligans]
MLDRSKHWKIKTVAVFLLFPSLVWAEKIQFGGLTTDLPYAGASRVVEWNGDYTNLVSATGSSGNGTFDGAGAGASLTCPDDGLVMTAIQITQADGATPGVMNAGSRIGIDGGRSDSINPSESLALSFDADVELIAFDFQAITALDLYEISWNGTSVTNSGDYTFSAGVVLTAGSPLTLRGLVSGGDLADARTDSFNFESLTVESVSSPAVSNLMLTVTDRAGTNRTGTLLVDSDHIHLEVSSPTNITTCNYKLLFQTVEPSAGEWSAATAYGFLEDLWFYRTPTNQWVQISVSDASSDAITEVVGLQGGTLTAPPDDPITNFDYVDAMGIGLIVEADSDKDPIPELDVIEIKKAGFGHVRMHIGRFLQDKMTPNTPQNNPEYFQLLDRWVEQISRHGMYCHIGNKGNAEWELANEDDGSNVWKEGYAAEHFAWWTNVLDHCKFDSHRLAYHLFLETGGNSFMGDAASLDAFHDSVTKEVRLVDQGRMLICPPPSLNNVFRLVEMTFPYEDHDAGDGIDTSSGNYWFSDFHKNFAGGRGWVLDEDKQIVIDNLNEAKDWIAANNVPLIMSAVRPTDSNARHDEYIPHRIRFVENLYSLCDSADIPIRITWLSYNNYNFTQGLGWRPGMLPVLEAMNRSGTAVASDPDGDQISTDDEINLYGTNPYLADTDQDNILDTYECTMAAFDPLDPSDGDPMADLGIMADFDGDGMDNAWELLMAVKWGDDPLTTTHLFDPLDPADALQDAENDGVTNIWERILRINARDDISYKDNDATYDWDKDGTDNLTEIIAQTWPMEDDKLEFDSDYDTVGGDVDTMPYIHDQGHVVGYTYGTGLSDISSQGSDNDGVLTGGATVSNGIALLDGVDDFIDIPTTDLGSSTNRSVSLHFWSAQSHGTQVLYKEGGADSGMSIYLSGITLWAGVWNQPQETFVQLGTILPQQWYSVAASFESGSLSCYFYNGNSRLVSTNLTTSVLSIGDAAFRAALGGSADATRIWSGSESTIVSDACFSGHLDDSHIYNRVLAEGEASLLARNDLYPARQPVLPATLPYFTVDSIEADAVVGEAFSSALTAYAMDPNDDPLTFLKLSGSAWLNVSSNGVLSGTPGTTNVGVNRFIVQVADSVHGSDTATLEIEVLNLAAPIPFNANDRDTYVQANKPGDNFGDDTGLTMRNSSSGFARVPYLQFVVSGLTNPVGKAVLKLRSDDSSAPVKVYAVVDNNWTESSLVWSNRPTFGVEIGEGTAVAGSWFEIDITGYVSSNGTWSVALDEQDNLVTKLISSEGGSAPVLEIRTVLPMLGNFYEQWGAENGLVSSNSSYDIDADGDGLVNLLEYAFGGNPTTGAEMPPIIPTGKLVANGGSNVVDYIYRRRADAVARGLSYRVETATDLVSNVWNTNGYIELPAAWLEPGFESVTNRMDTISDMRFIRLKIEATE